MREAAKYGIVGMLGGTAIGGIALIRSFGSDDWFSEASILIFMGSLFVGLVMGIFTFLVGLAVTGKR